MKLSKRQLKRIIREEKSKLISENLGIEDGEALDHVLTCFVNGQGDNDCADRMPDGADVQVLMEFANFIQRVVNTYREFGNF